MAAISAQPRACSIARTLDIVGEKWALLAVREVFLGNRTFDEMVRLDLKYAASWSLLLDITILLQTPWAVISGQGAY